MQIVISSGHGKYVRGASGYIDEVDEARKVVERVADYLTVLGVGATTYHDDVSKTQSENLGRIVDFHNSKTRDLDISVHFNAYKTTTTPMGTECLYVTQSALATEVSASLAEDAGFINRGAKYRSDLYFLNNTTEPAILIEVCFVDSQVDTGIYSNSFDAVCRSIAESVCGRMLGPPERPEDLPPIEQVEVVIAGACSWFGGPDDDGVSPSEGLAFIYDVDEAPYLFLPRQPPGTSGLARRLDPDVFYVACRWDYNVTPKTTLAQDVQALVRAPGTGKEFLAWPADWGPHIDTGRVADISPGLMRALGIETDDIIEVIYPAPVEV